MRVIRAVFALADRYLCRTKETPHSALKLDPTAELPEGVMHLPDGFAQGVRTAVSDGQGKQEADTIGVFLHMTLVHLLHLGHENAGFEVLAGRAKPLPAWFAPSKSPAKLASLIVGELIEGYRVTAFVVAGGPFRMDFAAGICSSRNCNGSAAKAGKPFGVLDLFTTRKKSACGRISFVMWFSGQHDWPLALR